MRLVRFIWRPVGAAYVILLLSAFAAGLFPDALVASEDDAPAPLPVLPCLAVAQVAFFLLVYPIALSGRKSGRAAQRGIELLGFLVTALPFLAAGAYLGDAVARDVVRAELAVLACWPVALGAGRLMRRPAFRAGVLLGLLLIAIAMPVACYGLLDILDSPTAQTLWQAAPATFAWANAQSRLETTCPTPLWPWLGWAAAGLVLTGLASWKRATR